MKSLLTFPTNLLIIQFLLILTLLGCDSNVKEKYSIATTSSQHNIGSNKSKIPQFEGKWISEDGNWKITIQNVNDTVYDVKFQNDEKKLRKVVEDSSGAFTLSADQKSITKNSINNEWLPYIQISFSKDGRLYSNSAIFYVRQ